VAATSSCGRMGKRERELGNVFTQVKKGDLGDRDGLPLLHYDHGTEYIVLLPVTRPNKNKSRNQNAHSAMILLIQVPASCLCIPIK